MWPFTESKQDKNGEANYVTIIDHRDNQSAVFKLGPERSLPASLLQTSFSSSASKKDGDGVSAEDGIRMYDPGFTNTAVVKSAISFIDGEKGILRYRGYAIEELAEKSTFLEVAYLLIYGHLPTKVLAKKYPIDLF